MKTVGLIGGIGPESTIEYYRFIIEGYRRRITDGTYPPIVINSIDLSKLVAWMDRSQLAEVAHYLVAAIEKLAAAKADFVAIAANTPHIVFNQVRDRSPLPMVSIVEATRDQASALGLRRLGLLGTGFTMRSHFYQDAFAEKQMEIIVPNAAEQDYIHEKYFGELLKDAFLPETRARFLAIADDIKAREDIEAVILGGTEIPLLLRTEAHNGMQLLDTTRIHVDRLIKEMLT